MSLPDEERVQWVPPTCAHWKEIERALGGRGPLPDDVRRGLWEMVRLLNLAVEGDNLLVGQTKRLTAKQAAALVLEILGLTGHAIGAYREARRADTAVGWLEWMKKSGILKRGQKKAFLADLAKGAGVKPSHIYRLARSRRARGEK